MDNNYNNNNNNTDNSNKKTIGLAIVGCGQIATHHLAAIASISSSDGKQNDNDNDNVNNEQQPQFIIHALVDPSAERRKIIRNLPAASSLFDTNTTATKNAVAEFDTLDDLLQATVADTTSERLMEKIHIIFIAVPHDLHESLATQALTAAKAKHDIVVVLEKPLAPTAEACRRLVTLSSPQTPLSSTNNSNNNTNNNMLIVAEQSPFWPAVAKAKTLIHQENGAIGTTIVAAAAYYYESMRDNVTSGSVDTGSGALGWRGSLQRAGGGIGLDGGLHWLRPLREWCGRTARVTGVTRRHLAPALQCEGEVLAHALLEMEEPPPASGSGTSQVLKQPEHSGGPLVATYSCNMLATAPMAHDCCPYFRITGNQGELVIHGDGLFAQKPGAGGLRIYNDEHPNGKELLPLDQKGGFFLGFAGLWTEIRRIYLQNDREAAHETVVRAAEDVATVLALYKSSESGQWERTESFREC